MERVVVGAGVTRDPCQVLAQFAPRRRLDGEHRQPPATERRPTSAQGACLNVPSSVVAYR